MVAMGLCGGFEVAGTGYYHADPRWEELFHADPRWEELFHGVRSMDGGGMLSGERGRIEMCSTRMEDPAQELQTICCRWGGGLWVGMIMMYRGGRGRDRRRDSGRGLFRQGGGCGGMVGLWRV